MGWWKRWKAKHWDTHVTDAWSTPDLWSPGSVYSPPLRRAVDWVFRLAAEKPIEVAGLVLATIATAAAVIALLR